MFHHYSYCLIAEWSDAEQWGQESEVAWQYHVGDDGLAYTISYAGEHYSVGETGQVSLHLNRSEDGRTWRPVSDAAAPFSIGGISEVPDVGLCDTVGD